MATAVAALALLALAVVACGGGGSSSNSSGGGGSQSAQSSGSDKPVTLKVWVGWSARELKVFKGVVADYTSSTPT